jgi:TPR repeat protein
MISINDLPNEVLLNIFDNFTNKANIKNLLACSQVSQLWRLVALDRQLWIGKAGVGAIIAPDQAFKIFHKQEKGESAEEIFKKGLKSQWQGNTITAKEYFKMAAKKGHPDALDQFMPYIRKQFSYNPCPYDTSTIEANRWEKLFKLFQKVQKPDCCKRKLSKLGLQFLCNRFADNYPQMDLSLRKAIFCFKQAAEKGSLQAKAVLLQIQRSDDKEHPLGQEDMGKNHANCLKELKIKAKLIGFPEESYQVGLRYLSLEPEGCPSRVVPNLYSEARAIKYFVKASEQNHQKAQELMAFIKKNISTYISLTKYTNLYEKENAFFKSISNK